MSDWSGLLWLVLLLLGNAFFVASEFAVISARRSQIEPKAEKGKKSAIVALWAMEHATLMLATTQLGITVCSLMILNVSEPAIHHLLLIPLGLTGWSGEIIAGIAFAITLVLVSYLHVVFGEMVPKNLSFSKPDTAVLLLARPLVWLSRVLRPVIWLLNEAANGVLRLFRVEPKSEAASAFTLEEVATIVSQSTREGVLEDSTGTLVAAFEFTNKKVRDVAIPLEQLVTLQRDATPSQVQRMIAKRGFSRYVIVDAEGQPSGYIHLKDLLRESDERDDEPIAEKRIRQLVSLFDGADLEDALASMRVSGAHVAQAFDSDGNTTGVLFLEDIIEELVGTVEDATQRH